MTVNGTMCPSNVRFWHEADIEALPANVCFWGNSGHCPGGPITFPVLEPRFPVTPK